MNAAFTRNRKQQQSTMDADNIKKEGRKEAIGKFRAQLEDAFTLADLMLRNAFTLAVPLLSL